VKHLESLVPFALEGICNQPVLGVDQHELAARHLSFVADALQLVFVKAIDFVLSPSHLLKDLDCQIQGCRGYGVKHESGNRLVHATARNGPRVLKSYCLALLSLFFKTCWNDD